MRSRHNGGLNDLRPTGGYVAALFMRVFRQGGVLKIDLVCLRFWVVRIPSLQNVLDSSFLVSAGALLSTSRPAANHHSL